MNWLRRFWPRLLNQLNVTAGVAGIAALVLTMAGLISPGTAKKVLIASGIALAAVTLIVATVRAWPPHIRNLAEVVGKELQIADLAGLNPPVPAVGLIGDAAVGKTTLKGRLLQQPAQQSAKTDRVTARIGMIQTEMYIAILDGRGEIFAQQFEVAERTDILIVLLDHNDIDTSNPNQERMEAHIRFGKQLRDYLVAHPRMGRRVHVLLNKRDKWQSASDGQQQELRGFFAEEVSEWRNAFGPEVTSAEHSNDYSADIGALAEQIRSHWQRSQEIVRNQSK
jgi:hypothetical protein